MWFNFTVHIKIIFICSFCIYFITNVNQIKTKGGLDLPMSLGGKEGLPSAGVLATAALQFIRPHSVQSVGQDCWVQYDLFFLVGLESVILLTIIRFTWQCYFNCSINSHFRIHCLPVILATLNLLISHIFHLYEECKYLKWKLTTNSRLP